MKTTKTSTKIVGNHTISNKFIVPMVLGVMAFVALAAIEPKPYTDSYAICQVAHINAGYSSNIANAYCSF